MGSPDNECSIRELAVRMKDIYCAITGKNSKDCGKIINVSSERFYGKGYEDSNRRVPDISKAKTLLRWSPRVGLDEALTKTILAYIRDYGHLPMKKGGRSWK